MTDHTHEGRKRTSDDVNALNNVLTPDMVAAGWVRLPGGGLVPPNVTNPNGWQADRDTVNTAEVTTARKAMSDATLAYAAATAKLYAPDNTTMVADMVTVIAKADAMVEAWHRFAEATGGAE